MSKGAYTYEPGNITEFGKDRMRFELGDTMVEGLADTTALTDEEIQAAIDAYPNKWKRAKLMLLESLCRRFAYEVNTKTGPLSLDMNGRAKLWKEDYDKLKKRMDELGLDRASYWWYLELRKYGSTPHAGFGLGFERLIMYLTGVSNIRDVLPFPRTTGSADF